MITLGLDEIVRAVGGKFAATSKPLSISGVSTDTRALQPGDLFVALTGENFDGHAFVAQAFARGARAALVAESAVTDAASGPLVLVDDSRSALCRLAAYHRRQLKTKVIAVTGSNGKTTTKNMIHHVLGACLPGRAAEKSFNNDIGVPLTLLSAEASDRYLVVEIGSSAPGEVARLAALASPDIAVVTSIGHAHLAGFGDIDAVVREKLSLLEHVAPGGIGIVNLNDLRMFDHGPFPDGLTVVTFGTDAKADVRVTTLDCRLEGVTFQINDRYEVRLPVPGAHNAINAAATFAVGRRMRLAPERIVGALATVRLPDMRLNVRRLNGLTLVEDCYNANPSSMAAGIKLLRTVRRGRRVLIAGAMKELGTLSDALHRETGVLAARSGVDLVVAVGREAGPIVDGARSFNSAVTAHVCDTTDQACDEVPPLLAEGDTVLIKGSRAVGLERVSRRIVERFSVVVPQ